MENMEEVVNKERTIGARHKVMRAIFKTLNTTLPSILPLRGEFVKNCEFFDVPKSVREEVLNTYFDVQPAQKEQVVTLVQPPLKEEVPEPLVLDEFDIMMGVPAVPPPPSLESRMREVLDSTTQNNSFCIVWEPITHNGENLILCSTSRYRQVGTDYEWNINGQPTSGGGTLNRLSDEKIRLFKDGQAVVVSKDYVSKITIPGQDRERKYQVSKLAGQTVDVEVTVWLWALRKSANTDLRFWLNESNGSRKDLRGWTRSLTK